MEPGPVFPTDLFSGTAPYYDRYRPPYPDALFDDLCRRLPVSGAGDLLDLACGTGQVALPLCRRFARVVAVDQEDEFIVLGRAKAERFGIAHVEWITGAAETVPAAGPFELVTVGNAFHRLNRPAVAERMFSWVKPGGGVALVWGETPHRGDRDWQRAMAAVLEAWTTKLGVVDRGPAGWEEHMDRYPGERILGNAGFDYVGRFEFSVEESWTVETLTGFVYSTSFLSRPVVGRRAPQFEAELGAVLRACSSEGTFQRSATYAYQLARKPA